MKAPGKIIVLALAALVVCFLGWTLLWSRREPWARIRFSKARFSKEGTLTIAYDFKVSSGATLHEVEFRDGANTADSEETGGSLFGWPLSGSSEMSSELYPSEIAAAPTLLVETGKMYNLDVHSQLPLYDFTNKSGVRCQGRFLLQRESTQ